MTLDAIREVGLRLRFADRPLSDIVKAYEAAPDNLTLQRLVERDLDSLRLRPDPSARGTDADIEAQHALKRAIAARRAERTDTAVVAQIERLRKLKGGVSLSALIQFAKDGSLLVARKR